MRHGDAQPVPLHQEDLPQAERAEGTPDCMVNDGARDIGAEHSQARRTKREVSVLAISEVARIEAADAVQGRTTDERRRTGTQEDLFTDEVALPGRLSPAPTPVEPVSIEFMPTVVQVVRPVTEQDSSRSDIGASIQSSNQFAQAVTLHFSVGIQQQQQLTPRGGQSGVRSGREALVPLTADHAHRPRPTSLLPLRHDRIDAGILGVVVDQDDLDRLIYLPLERLHAALEVRAATVMHDHCGQQARLTVGRNTWGEGVADRRSLSAQCAARVRFAVESGRARSET